MSMGWAFALNQHKEATESLLQKLIPRKLVDLNSVLQSYTSGVLNITKQSINIMDAALQNLNFNQTEKKMKEMLMNCILNLQSAKSYSHLLYPETATFLVNLTLKQWPIYKLDYTDRIEQKINKIDDITDIYFKTILEKTVVPPEITKKCLSEKIFIVDNKSSETFIDHIRNFVCNTSSEPVEVLLGTVVLLLNVTSCMINYKILDEMDLYENKSNKEIHKLLELGKIKDLVPLELIRSLAETLNCLQEDHKEKSELTFDLKKQIITTLSNFGCVSNGNLNRNQNHILEVMAAPSYNCTLDSDYILLLTFLNSLKLSKPGVLPESILDNVLKSIQEVCAERYHCSENAVQILNILNDLYPHLTVVNSEEIKTTSVQILIPFYEKRGEYGPEVSLALLNCMSHLCQLDPESNFAITKKFVSKAIQTLVVFFQVMSKSKVLQDFHKQEEIFCKMYEKSLEVFEITGELTQERQTDEIISRTASVLHTFISLVLRCNSWIEECLYTLVKLTFIKNLGSVNKALEIINRHLCGKSETNCIEKYLEYILEKWLSEDCKIDSFPFTLFHCENKSEFYLNNFEICVPLLMVSERKDLIAAACTIRLDKRGYRKNFLKKILVGYTDIFENHLTFVVNSLMSYAVTDTAVTNICIEILHFLIVENSCLLNASIEKLDNFPQQEKFNNIRAVHHKIKYGNKAVSLEEEINFFLQHEGTSNRQDSLVHLRDVLSKQKVQLKEMYDKLQNIRGFSEDCRKSLLHRLMCMLAKMSCSENENVKFESLKCLGEIGPANLRTLVLQPGLEMSDEKRIPFDLLTGHLLSLLGECVTDPDVKLVQAASKTLYIVLDSKEGRKMAESNVNFGHGLIDKNATVNMQTFMSEIDDDLLWNPIESISHEKWIITLVVSLLKTFSEKSFLPKLVPICNIAPKLCEYLLPLILNLLLYINHKTINHVLSEKINLFFASHWRLTVPKYLPSSSINANKKSVNCMLEVVSFVRLQKAKLDKDTYGSRQMGELKLDYLKVAKAAEFCSAHFTSLLYSELWCQARMQEIEKNQKNLEYVVQTKLDIIYEIEEEQIGEALQDILRNELGKWDQVTHFYEMQISQGATSVQKDLMDSLKKCSLYQLPLLFTKQSDETQYECFWRLGQWVVEEKVDTRSTVTINPTDYEKYRFHSLKALHDNNEYAFEAAKSLKACA
ncbi:hypothetical protein NQ317_013561 [Molorchus minor]|uniref:Uncharacterized protein n=1 Tax=Molorchus minor TaxID=1323400 RepID=A0ABQ9JIJ7_9CUCU|nr:hypothetical protein NQ317_013561 [Molorchus minor]